MKITQGISVGFITAALFALPALTPAAPLAPGTALHITHPRAGIARVPQPSRFHCPTAPSSHKRSPYHPPNLEGGVS